MGRFLGGISDKLSRFLRGRNGADQLGTAMLAVYLALVLLRSAVVLLTHSHVAAALLDAALLAVGAAFLWRFLSKNLAKRRAENARFLAWWRPKQARIAAARARRLDKGHRYFTCKACGATCRVPAGKGRIEVTCPQCGGSFQAKS